MLLCLILLFFTISTAFGQSEEETLFVDDGECGYTEVYNKLILEDPGFHQKRLAFNKLHSKKVKNGTLHSNLKSSVPDTLPVVVHIMHHGASLGSKNNPTDLQVANTIEEFSQRFRHQQPNAPEFTNPFYGVDTEIDFCLATTDPNNQYTSGVTRHFVPEGFINSGTNLAVYAWDTDLYCNIFISKQINATNTLAGIYIGGSIDITVFRASSFWSGLLAHEVGHYLTLDHPFGNCINDDCTMNGDQICDTPPKETSSFAGGDCTNPGDNCQTDEDDTSMNNPYRSTGLGGMGNQPDMLANYMDYTGSCWNSFTVGQKNRMQLDISENRLALSNNSEIACQLQATPANDVGIFGLQTGQADICSKSFYTAVTIVNYGSSTLTSVSINIFINNNLVLTEEWTGNLLAGETELYTLTNLITYDGPVGIFLLSAATETPNGMTDANVYNDVDYMEGRYIEGNNCMTLDICESFNPQTAMGPGNTTVLNTTQNLPCAENDILICISVQGDVSSSSERFNVIDESGGNRGMTLNSGDCANPLDQLCFFVTSIEYNDWVTDGVLSIILDPISTGINPIYCGINRACITITIPEAPSVTYYADMDGDGFGDINAPTINCPQPANTVINADDCDDNNPNINPDAVEIEGNDIDEDCDGISLMTSTYEFENARIRIYPSPVSQQLNIEIQGILNYKVKLFDLSGKLILSGIDSRAINVSMIPRGIYLLKISDLNSNPMVFEKVVIDR